MMLELSGGHNDVGFTDDSLGRALARFWPDPDQSIPRLVPTTTPQEPSAPNTQACR